MKLLEADPRRTTREMADELTCSHTAVNSHLQALGKVKKQSVWVPHDLSEFNRQCRVEACTSLLSLHLTTSWLDSVVTGDEKWVLYDNVVRRHAWVSKGEPAPTQPKVGLHPRKVMLSVWWDVNGVILFELLPHNTTITASLYCDQLERLKAELYRKRQRRRTIRFLHDNARPHTAKMTREKLLELGWEILPHPPYSPDLAPSDYHLFRSLQNHLRGKTFANDEEIAADLSAFFDGQPQSFYARGVRQLPQRWRQVIDNDGDYILD